MDDNNIGGVGRNIREHGPDVKDDSKCHFLASSCTPEILAGKEGHIVHTHILIFLVGFICIFIFFTQISQCSLSCLDFSGTCFFVLFLSIFIHESSDLGNRGTTVFMQSSFLCFSV